MWPPSLLRDRKWPRVTKYTHSRMVALRLEGNLVILLHFTFGRDRSIAKAYKHRCVIARPCGGEHKRRRTLIISQKKKTEWEKSNKLTDPVWRLSEINQHRLVVGVMSLCVVPDDVTAEAMTFLIYQYIPTHTCVQRVHALPHPHLLYMRWIAE